MAKKEPDVDFEDILDGFDNLEEEDEKQPFSDDDEEYDVFSEEGEEGEEDEEVEDDDEEPEDDDGDDDESDDDDDYEFSEKDLTVFPKELRKYVKKEGCSKLIGWAHSLGEDKRQAAIAAEAATARLSDYKKESEKNVKTIAEKVNDLFSKLKDKKGDDLTSEGKKVLEQINESLVTALQTDAEKYWNFTFNNRLKQIAPSVEKILSESGVKKPKKWAKANPELALIVNTAPFFVKEKKQMRKLSRMLKNIVENNAGSKKKRGQKAPRKRSSSKKQTSVDSLMNNFFGK